MWFTKHLEVLGPQMNTLVFLQTLHHGELLETYLNIIFFEAIIKKAIIPQLLNPQRDPCC